MPPGNLWTCLTHRGVVVAALSTAVSGNNRPRQPTTAITANRRSCLFTSFPLRPRAIVAARLPLGFPNAFHEDALAEPRAYRARLQAASTKACEGGYLLNP